MASQNSKVVEIISNTGEITNYEKVSSRVPKFLEKYGPEQGYAILSSSVDEMETTPGKKALLVELARHGDKVTAELVATALLNQRVVFKCQLVDREGRVLAEASAVKGIEFQKNYESGETAAFQRLMAKLGFGGEILDEDEEGDMISQNLNYSTSTASKVVPIAEVSSVEPKGKPEQAKVESTAKPKTVIKTDAKAPVKQPNPKPAPKAVTSGTKKVDADKLQIGLLRQLAMLAKVKQVEVPDVETSEELRSELARLHKLPIPQS
jgi:hypothetical protein|tara:strand:+ start:2885 stop:3679 length:795 start_codon:yes stop_codon:yes gene_type:complete